MFDKVKDSLGHTKCVKLQSIVLDGSCYMVAPPLLNGCKKLSKIVLWQCDVVTTCLDIDVPGALKTMEFFVSSKVASMSKSLESCYELSQVDESKLLHIIFKETHGKHYKYCSKQVMKKIYKAFGLSL